MPEAQSFLLFINDAKAFLLQFLHGIMCELGNEFHCSRDWIDQVKIVNSHLRQS